MALPRARVVYSVTFFTVFMALMIYVRPACLFSSQDGRVIPFGVGRGQSLFSLGVVTVVAAAVSLFSFAFIDLLAPPQPLPPPAALASDRIFWRAGTVPTEYV